MTDHIDRRYFESGPRDIHFGALAPPLVEQLRGVLPHNVLRMYDKTAKQITTLAAYGWLTDKETHRIRQRLVNQLVRKVRKREKAGRRPRR